MRSSAPRNPPITLATIMGSSTRRETLKRRRYAPPLAATPTHNANVLVAFAGTGGTPVNNKAGKLMKLPPPATALMAPASAPAKKRSRACGMVKVTFLTRLVGRSQSNRAPGGTRWRKSEGMHCVVAAASGLRARA